MTLKAILLAVILVILVGLFFRMVFAAIQFGICCCAALDHDAGDW